MRKPQTILAILTLLALGMLLIVAAGGANERPIADATPTAARTARADTVPTATEEPRPEPTAEMPEHAPNTGGGGMAAGVLPLVAVAALLALLAAGGYALLQRR